MSLIRYAGPRKLLFPEADSIVVRRPCIRQLSRIHDIGESPTTSPLMSPSISRDRAQQTGKSESIGRRADILSVVEETIGAAHRASLRENLPKQGLCGNHYRLYYYQLHTPLYFEQLDTQLLPLL